MGVTGAVGFKEELLITLFNFFNKAVNLEYGAEDKEYSLMK